MRVSSAAELCLWHLLALLGHCSEGRCPNHTLTIAAFVPCYDDTSLEWTGSQCDVFVYSAAQLAADHINRDPTILTNVTVQIQPLRGQETLTILTSLGMARESELHGVLVTQDYIIAQLSTALVTDKLQVPAVSYGINEMIVRSNLFYLTIPSDVFVQESILAMLNHFRWFKVGLLSSTEERFLKEFENFLGVFNAFVTVKTNGAISVAFTGTFANEHHITNSLTTIRQRDIRVVVGFFGEKDATNVLCRASQVGLTTPDHVWILPSYFDPNWWQNADANCTSEEIKDALESVIFIGPVKYPPFLLSNQSFTPLGFRSELVEKTRGLFPSLPLSNMASLLTHSKATSAYDAVWTIASVWSYLVGAALCENNTTPMTEMERALNTISDSEFLQLWKNCGFTQNSSDRTAQNYYGQVLITQFHDGQECPVGMVLPTFDERDNFVRMRDVDSRSCLRELHLGQWIRNFTQYSTNCTLDFQWEGGTPLSGFSLEISKIDSREIVSVSVVSLLVMVFIVTVLILNLIWKNNKYIKAGSPRLSVIVLVGFLFLLPIPTLAALIVSAEAYHISTAISVDVLCWLLLWLRFLGPVLIFSTLLVTNYRIYRVFHNKKLETQDGGLTDKTLFVAAMLFTLFAIIILIAETIANPQQYKVSTLTKGGEYDYMFVGITTCSENKLSMARDVYMAVLTATVLFFAFLNMKLTSRFRQEGVATCLAVTLIAFFYFMYIIIIYSNLVELHNYNGVFQLTATFFIAIPPIAVIILFMPKFGLMYRDYRQRMHKKSQSEIQSDQVEYYHSLCKQVAQLKGELAQIERRIEMVRSGEKSSDAMASSHPVTAERRRGSYLWRVLQTKVFTRSQLSRNHKEPGVYEGEESREEGWGTEVVTEIEKGKGRRLPTISEENYV